jgi:hypothetical protein
VKVEKGGLAEATGEEEEVMVVEAAVTEEAVGMAEAEEAMVKEGEAAEEVMEEEEGMGEIDRPNEIGAPLRFRKVKRSMLQLNPLGDAGMGSPVSITL